MNKIIEKKPRAFSTAGSAYNLDENLLRGLRTAATNSQTRLALEYLVNIVMEQEERIAALEADKPRVLEDLPAEVPEPVAEEPKKATPRKKETNTDGASE